MDKSYDNTDAISINTTTSNINITIGKKQVTDFKKDSNIVNIPASNPSRLLGKKRGSCLIIKAKPSRTKSVIDEVEDINVNMDYNISDFYKPGDQTQLYCICNGVSEGDMVACDYAKVVLVLI
jgi:hypothetical protein